MKTEKNANNGLLSPKQAAAFAGCCKKTVLDVWTRQMPVIRLGKRTLRFRREDVEAFLQRRTVAPTATN